MCVSDSRWKVWLAPSGLMLIFICGIYFAANSLLVSDDAKNIVEKNRPSSRADVYSKGVVSVIPKQPDVAAKENDIQKRATIRESKASERVKIYQSVRRKLVSREGSIKSEPGKSGRSKTTFLSKRDSQRKLREQIMDEAYRVAMHSEKPWQNLSAISSEYYRRGDRPTAHEVMRVAAKLAVDPDDMLGSSEAVRHVVQKMLGQRQNKDAMTALKNILHTDEREKAMAEVAVWAAREGRLSTAKGITAQISKASVRDTAFVAIAESQASYEGGEAAFNTAENVGNKKKKNDTYRRIALKRARLQDFQEAALAIAYIDDNKSRDSALSQVARERARSGDLKEGLRTLQGMTDPSLEDATLRAFSDELAKSGWFSSSAYVTTRIYNDRDKSHALERLSLELAKAGDVSASLIRSDTIPLLSVRERTLRNVSTVTADQGSPERARNVALRILSDDERDKAYSNIVKAAANNGNHTAAFNTLQDIDDPKDKALAMVSLARAHQQDGRGRKALALLESANREARYLESITEQDIVRADMALAYAEGAEPLRSLSIVDKMESVSRRDKAYKKLAKEMALQRDIESAQRSLLSISSDSIRRSAEDSVAKTLARSVSPKKAVSSSKWLHTGRQRIIFLLEISKRT